MNKRRGQVCGKGVRGFRILIDNPRLSGPRIIVGKGWIFMSFWSSCAFLVGRIFKCVCVGHQWMMNTLPWRETHVLRTFSLLSKDQFKLLSKMV